MTTALDDDFRAGMRRLASGVSLVTSAKGTVKAGLIATAVNSVSADPPTLLVCINRAASGHDIVQQSGCFCVNLLAVEDLDLALLFSDPARRSERFATGLWSVSNTGAPVLLTSMAAFDCRVAESLSHRTHTIFIGEVAAVTLPDRAAVPLLYFERRFRSSVLALVDP